MTVRSMLAVVLVLTAALLAHARYGGPQLANVPIDRVLANLAKQAEANPKDADAKFKLARAYSMGYASKNEQVKVVKPRRQPPKLGGNGPVILKTVEELETDLWFGHHPPNQPLIVRPTDDKKTEELAQSRLVKAIETYKAALNLDSNNLVGRLGYAWTLDQAKRKKEALAEYRKVIEAGWNKERPPRPGLISHSITHEAGRYALALLDPEADAAEIKQLNERFAQIETVQAISPIIIPLRPGLQARDLEDPAASISFDADGSGLKAQRWTWIKPNAGWLVIDRRETGKIESGLQLFGNVTFWMFWNNGYEPLAALDDNGDGELRGAEVADLAIWCDANCNGVSEPGEVRPLAAHGIVALNCRYEIDREHPDRIEFSRAGVTFSDGTTRPTWDIKLHAR